MIFNKLYKRVSGIDFFVKRGTVVKKDGLTVPKIAVATFDTAGNDSSAVSNKTVAAHGLGVYLPDNAIVTRAWYDVVTTFTTASSDAGTIALKVNGANDLIDALAVSGSGNIWDAGMHQCLPNNFALDGNSLAQIDMGIARDATMIKTTAERELTATVATQALTAGKLVLYVEYVISD